MSKINWNLIDWHAFETLVSILILHKDIEAKTYLRFGRDAGIDIESGNGKVIYQIKYINNQENFSDIISKAKKELENIKQYRLANHKNFKYWCEAKEWHLITNASYNKKDQEKWKNQIEEPFLKEVGLKVKLKHNTWLKKELIHIPNLIAEYFEGNNRVLLSVPEAISSKKNDIIFFKGFDCVSIKGREKELEKFSAFIEANDKKIIPIHGQGGIGKTRFAIETAIQTNKKGYDVFWANTATMEKSTNWFQSIVTGRKTLLIIDEPTEKKLIEILLEQINSQRITNWKFAIITRSAKDHILKPLNPNRINTISEPIELSRLGEETTKKIISDLIEKSDKLKSSKNINKNELQKVILNLSGGLPIWVIIAFKMFEERGNIIDLSKDGYGLAEDYIKECLSSFSEDWTENRLYEVLKAITILQPVYTIEDNSYLYENYFKFLVEDITELKLKNVFKILEEKKLASKRGRLLEIKPDVIRDYIILKKIGENKEESRKWLKKILNMASSEKKKSALKQLARIAYYNKAQGQNETFLDSTWDIFITKAKTSKLKELKNIFELADSISFSNLPKFVDFIKNIQRNPNEREPVGYFFGEENYLYIKDLILQSAWALYETGVYAQSKEEAMLVFKELLNLAEKEEPFIKSKPFPYSDSSRAVRVIERLMSKHVYSDSVDTVSNWIIERLDEINNLNEDQIAVLKILITDCFFKLEKNILEFIDNKFIRENIKFHTESKLNKCRNEIFKKIWLKLDSGKTELKKRKELWTVLNTYQRQLNYINKITGEINIKDQQEKELEINLNRVKKYLSEKNVSIFELSALRNIWKWHLKYDTRPFFKKKAEECEKLLFEKSKIDIDFISLYDSDTYDLKSKRFQEYSKNLNSENKIYSFMENHISYSKKNSYILIPIAQNLGSYQKLPDHVLKYVNTILNSNKKDDHFKLVCEIILAQSNELKKTNTNHFFNFLISYWNQCNSIERKEIFLNTIYNPKPKLNLRTDDIKFISEVLFKSNVELSEKMFYILSYFSGSILFVDFAQSEKMIKYILQRSELNKRATMFKNFIEASNDRNGIIRHSQITKELSFKPEKLMFHRLIGLLKNIPSIDFSDIHGGEGLMEVKKDLMGQFSVIDFIPFLKERLELIENKNDSVFKNIFLDHYFIKIIDPIKKEYIFSQNIKNSLNILLDFNNHPLLYYKLPDVFIEIDPEGFLIPELITKKINDKVFLWKQLKDTAPEYEWTRYAGYYPINSRQWRVIAKTACNCAIKKIEKEKISIFSSLLDQEPQVITSRLGEVSPYYYSKVEKARSDLAIENNQNIKEFMKWRLKLAEKELEDEKLRIIEENHE